MGIEHKAGDDLYNRGTGDAETDIEQPPRRPAHPPGHRDADQEGRGDPLYHDKSRLAETVEKADKAEQKAGQQAVDAVGPQIVKARRDHSFISGKDAAQQIAVEERRPEHHRAEGRGNQDGNFEAALGPLVLSRAVVLRHIGAHGLHERGGDQHDKGADLLRHAYAR